MLLVYLCYLIIPLLYNDHILKYVYSKYKPILYYTLYINIMYKLCITTFY